MYTRERCSLSQKGDYLLAILRGLGEEAGRLEEVALVWHPEIYSQQECVIL